MVHAHGFMVKKYVGNWMNGKMSGKGTCIWAGGIKYVGDWVNNNMHGEGIKIWANGDRYQGTFKNSRLYM